MSRTDRGGGSPRAVIHKQILDVAASRPDASLEGIADEVAGATVDLVERVFEEYGDPGADPDPEPTETEETAMKENGDQATEETTVPETDPSSLSDRQRETLRLVHDYPEWSQADIADRLDVSRATVSRRLNDIPGFEWQDRASFTDDVFDDEPGHAAPDVGEPGSEASGTETPGSEASGTGESGTDPDDAAGDATGDSGPTAVGNGAGVAVTGGQELLERFDDRLDRLEAQVAAPDGGPDLPADLAHKVVHAAMKSDRITEDEELRLIEALV